MGVTAGLIRYSAEVYDEVKASGRYYPPKGCDIQQCYLSRSWDELHPALRSFGPPLSLTLSGDYGLEGGLDGFGWDEQNYSDHYVAFVSPSLVKEIADQLRTLTFAKLATRLTEPSRGANSLAPLYQELIEFYFAASVAGDCVFIHVA